MFIEEVIIDGFKSYATRTVISGWDLEFNAITGLNGSGKSNILDSICFVLGIQMLSNLRANTLQDLIYKKGQAGVEKASVTLIFNNEDRSRSPIGYEDQKKISITRQIVVGGGGRNKYIINGVTAQQQKVFDLFQSVSLNVNNPHFLIMQGRITKVLNMKPVEILAMIEEAAGTRMFEDRKEKALKTMEKKETKVQEIVELLNQVILPKVNKLKEQKRVYLEYQKIETELDHLKRLLAAYEYYIYENKLDQSGQFLQEKQQILKDCEESIEEWTLDIQNFDAKISEIAAQREENGSQLAELEYVYNEAANHVVKQKTQLALKEQAIQEEEGNVQQLKDNKSETLASIKDISAKIEMAIASFEAEKTEHEEMVEHTKKQEQLLQTLLTGIAATEGQENGYMDQLKAAKQEETQANSDIEQAKVRLTHSKKELKEHEPKAKSAKKINSGLVADVTKAKKAVEKCEEQLSQLAVNEQHHETLLQDKDQLEREISELEETHDVLNRELVGVQFSYSDPTPRFDRSQVKGLVAELVHLQEDYLDSASALEVCAGGSLYHVIVDNETVGTQLIKNGNLKRRVTIIPLNKINAFKANAETVATAIKVSKGKANLALNLIGYEEDISKAMEYVFGSTFICQDAKTAKEITFHPQIRMRSVTIDGDLYDPSGSLSGGARSSGSGILLKLRQLHAVKRELNEKKNTLKDVNDQLKKIEQQMNAAIQVRQNKELQEHQLHLLEDQLKNNSSSKVIQLVEDLKNEISALDNSIQEATQRKQDTVQKQKEIQNEMQELTQHRDAKLKSLQNEIKMNKKLIGERGPLILSRQREIDVSQEELKQSEKEVETLEEQIAQVEFSIQEMRQEYKEMNKQLTALKRAQEEAERALEKERASLSAYDADIKQFESKKQERKQWIADAQYTSQQTKNGLATFMQDKKLAQAKVDDLLKKFPWIVDQRHLFGEEGTEYDFRQLDVEEGQEKKRQLTQRHDAIKRNVNPAVMETFDRLEKKQIALEQKLATVRKDKRKIESTIDELDKYKREALEKTWHKVNEDFGAIFGELLPGNSSKLEPPEGQDVTQGLEVKVCLGGVWKQSLTELSGGQRSLIALSLILSLLQFKPAPMYILDEIDSALDLSHTQNIGQLFKTRFKGSQFIVVSLKEGMFNNANVIFRTRFRDGLSMVERHAQKDNHQQQSGYHSHGSNKRGSMGASKRMSIPRPALESISSN